MAAIDSAVTAACEINGVPVILKEIDIADDSLQQNGLVKLRGKIIVSGIVVPPVNAVVRVGYTDKTGFTATVRRTFRVLSSFANVFTGLTDIEVGCKLTYLSNRKPPPRNPTSQEENSTIPEPVFTKANIPISAAFVVQRCLNALGLTANPSPATILTSRFALLEFDLSGGYVETMAKLLESESFVGQLDENDVLQIRSLDVTGGIGPVLTREKLISIGPIGSGALPGEEVVVSYSTRRFKKPSDDAPQRRNWEQWSITGGSVTALDTELDRNGNQIEVYRTYTESLFGSALYDNQDRQIYKIERRWDENGLSVTTTSTQYQESDFAEFSSSVTISEGSVEKVFDGCNFPIELFPTRASRPKYLVTLQKTITTSYTDRKSGYSQVGTTTQIPYIFTPMGKRVIGRLGAEATASSAVSLLGEAARLVEYGSTVENRLGRDFNGEKRPSQQERNNAELVKRDGPLVSESRFAWVFGDTEAEAITEFSIPYAPDDAVTWSPTFGFGVVPSNVEAVVLRYGRIQNKMLLGNRQGMNVVTLPKFLPPMAFDAVYVNLFGFIVEYRTNRMAWTGTGEKGIVATCDLMLWGIVGITLGTLISQAWTPLPPGTTALPTIPSSGSPGSPTFNAIVTPTPGGPYGDYTDYDEIIDSNYSLPLYSETIFSGGRIKLKGIYKKQLNPIVVFLEPGLVEITGNTLEYEVSTPVVNQVEVDLPTGLVEIRGNTFGYEIIPAPLDPILSLDFEAADGSTTFTDTSANAHSITAFGDAEIDTAEFFAGTASGYFPDVSSYIVVDESPLFALAPGQRFKISFRIRFADSTSTYIYNIAAPEQFYVNSDNTSNIRLARESGSGFGFIRFSNFNTTEGTWEVAGFFAGTEDVWHEIEIEQTNTNVILRVNGTAVVTTAAYPYSFNFGEGGLRLFCGDSAVWVDSFAFAA